jgi:hypothetical protein
LLDGYFQSEDYFINDEALVRHAFTPSKANAERASSLLGDIVGSIENYVAVHVRLGDYKSHALWINDRPSPYALSKEYYSKALESFDTNKPIALFSDEPELAIRLLPRPPRWIAPSAGAVETLIALSRFNFLVMANSSFSWWAAWLGGPENQVVAPEFHIGHAAGIWYPSDVRAKAWKYV